MVFSTAEEYAGAAEKTLLAGGLSRKAQALSYLHKELAVLQTLHATLADYGCDVVLVVSEAIQGKGRVVLQIAVARSHELQQRR